MADLPDRADLLDPATVASLGDIEITARWIVEGFLSGLHRSPRRGSSVEFAGHRTYQAGDDLRHLDWRIAARGDRLVVKEFEAETNLRAMILLDLSRSMDWSGDPARISKAEYARRLAAALALLLLRQHDAVGVASFDDGVLAAVPPRAHRNHWRRLAAALGVTGGAHSSRAAAALDDAARMLRRSGMIVLISDLLSEDDVLGSVRACRARGHDVLLLHVMDAAERDFPFTAEAVFTDPETAVGIPAVPSEVRAAYRSTVREVIEEWAEGCAATGADHVVVDTSVPFGMTLRAAFARRERLP
jgi:uncharacterized protein (DUF58 family)